MVKCVKCTKYANFNEKGNPPKYCADHKKKGMVNVLARKCIVCGIQASFGKEGTKKATHCESHKENDMVNVVAPKCLECKNPARFGIRGTKKSLYCGEHKKDGMIDVRHPVCLDCDRQAYFGIRETNKRLYCATHKKDGMLILGAKYCLECDTLANFNLPGIKKPLYCDTHKLDGMVDVKNRRCKGVLCDTHVRTKKYDGYCHWCFVHLFPEHKLSRSYKTKENAVAKFIIAEFPNIDFICDKKVEDGCSGKRPDMIADFGNWVFTIETDENGHDKYSTSCENKRLMMISEDLQHRPLKVFRFNPDGYTKDGVKVPSCWQNTKKGTVLVKTRQKEWDARLAQLKYKIQKTIDNPPTKTLSVCHLYFSD